ncbi:ADP-heptose:LPS heptosyltransferase [Abditibacterium utsteinense]|uniref:ADP-heptose:LPS heptosyltransferase n=1 Tax=Abditibacterium utsteinense TaxID=1960156 RepID=A0A2S8SX65_9BACT|nr:glycosyltransferase family 9 protein [Abditibacterium utsteinense]PQV65387.1 ADP-heptose:LPS heptosyltransferase [Abditibacterium utsteinense]
MKKNVSQRMGNLASAEAVSHSRAAKLASPVVMAAPVLKIATFHSSSLGSLVASFPALVALRDSFPGARICSFVRAPLIPLLENFAGVDEAHARPGGGLSSQAALMARLHSSGYDLALSFSQGSNALLLMWATGAPIRAGFVPSHMDALLTHKIAKSGPLRPLDALELVRSIGATPRGEKAHDFLWISPETAARARQMREDAGIARDFLLVSTQARKNSRQKNGDSAETGAASAVDAATLYELAARFDLLLVGSKAQPSLLREVEALRGAAIGAASEVKASETAHSIADLGGKTDVLTLAALCEMSRGVFGIGNGVLQFGKFYEKPVAMLSEGETAARALQTFGF